MTPAELLELDRAHVWHPYSCAVDPTPVLPVAGASGCRITLADGRELVDGMSSWWSAIHGYRHPVLDAALHEQVDRFSHVMFGGLTHEPAVALAELLVRVTPDPLTRVFLCDSGSVSVEVAMKMALQCWQGREVLGRNRFLTVRGGYHGDTTGVMSVTDPVNGMHGLFHGWIPQEVFAPRPRPAFDDAVTDADLADITALMDAHAHELAAVVVEPIVQGAGGMRFYAPEWLRRLRQLCDDRGLLLIADEVATGFGRTGKLFACEHAGVVPDIMCVGKALTGGTLSLAATLCTEEVAAGVSAVPGGAFMHGPTFMGNPLACAVARASVELLLSRPWEAEVGAIEAQLRAELMPLADHPSVAEVRVLGAIGVVELREPPDLKVLQPRLVEAGAWVRPFGRLVYTMPPYVITAEELSLVTSAIRTSVTGT